MLGAGSSDKFCALFRLGCCGLGNRKRLDHPTCRFGPANRPSSNWPELAAGSELPEGLIRRLAEADWGTWISQKSRAGRAGIWLDVGGELVAGGSGSRSKAFKSPLLFNITHRHNLEPGNITKCNGVCMPASCSPQPTYGDKSMADLPATGMGRYETRCGALGRGIQRSNPAEYSTARNPAGAVKPVFGPMQAGCRHHLAPPGRLCIGWLGIGRLGGGRAVDC
jgi:hypothetical protein